MKTITKTMVFFTVTAALALTASGQGTVMPIRHGNENDKVRRIRFVEDDAQNYMVSKVYELKHQKANDIVPFITGAIKRYASNGRADRINYKAAKRQLVSVSCPMQLMPYIDDMINKLDRPSPKVDRYGSGIKGTGMHRTVYVPQYRSSKAMVEVLTKTGIPSSTGEGAGQDAVVAFDEATNRVYWKDSINKNKDMLKYLGWLDRPVPQFTINLNVYQVRESDLLDLGIDYLAWKNGPGLNLFEAGAAFLEGSALAETFGPYGFFMFAPSFDFSFVRLLQQNGKAKLASSAALTISSGHDADLKFTPTYQNLTKDSKFASAVSSSSNDNFELEITKPVISLAGAVDKDGRLKYSEKDYAEQIGVLNFAYKLISKNVFQRNSKGEELYESSVSESTVSVQSGTERLLSRWSNEIEVEQTIGVPFLCEVPVLKYIFGTTTRTKEKHFFFLAAEVRLMHPDTDIASITGTLLPINELVNAK